jgi:signal transduction histidine kinase
MWLARAVAFAVVAAGAFHGHVPHHRVVVAGLVTIGVLLGLWAAIDAAPRFGHQLPGWGLTAVLGLMAAASGLLSDLGGEQTGVAFAFVAAVAAGSELDTGPAVAIGTIGVLAIEISALLFGFSARTDLGWPLLVIVGLLVGRNRRDARIQRAQGAALAAQALQTRSEQQRAATLDERSRMAREIHDLLAHTVGALGIQLATVHAILTDTGDVERAARLVDQARRLAGTGLQESRQAIHALRADIPPLPQSLANLAESHQHQHHTPVELIVSGNPRPLAADANLALTNTAKHAHTAAVVVTLHYGPGQTTMTVRNDLNARRHSTSSEGLNGGYGLAGMRERLLLIGGSLTAGPAGNCWTVEAQVPA